MNFGYIRDESGHITIKTKLDHIIENGLRRIDEAVEGVIDRHEWITPEANMMKKKCRINTDVVYIDAMNKSHVYPWDSAMGRFLRDGIAARSAIESNTYSGLMGDPRRSCAGMAAQQNPMANAYQQGLNTGMVGVGANILMDTLL